MSAPRQPVTLRPCPICGDIIARRPSDTPGYYAKRRTCGTPACSAASTGASHVARYTVVKARTCCICGTVIPRRAGSPPAEYQAKRTCGSACAGVLRSRSRTGAHIQPVGELDAPAPIAGRDALEIYEPSDEEIDRRAQVILDRMAAEPRARAATR